MLSRLIREILYNLVHLVISVFIFLRGIYRLFRTSYKSAGESVNGEDIKRVLEYRHLLKKKLNHLILVADTDYLNIEDLARVVIWSLLSGISYVSFYDVRGVLSKSEELFFHEVEKKKKGVPGCIKWSNKPNLNGYSNGTQALTINVNIFTKSDGCAKIAKCIKQIACKELRSHELTPQELDTELSQVYSSIPDPDVALYTGPVCCTGGMLPWQIRLTEFIQLSVNNVVTLDNFLGALCKYNNCDQRFGK